MAIKSRPLLQKHKQLISAAKSRLDLAERDYYPDFNVGVTYGDSTGQNPKPMGVLKTCRPYLYNGSNKYLKVGLAHTLVVVI